MSDMTDDALILAMSEVHSGDFTEARRTAAAIRPHLDALRARAERAEAERDRLREAVVKIQNQFSWGSMNDLQSAIHAALEARDEN